MTTYNTGNPVPSVSVKDLFDNCETEDEFVNGDAGTTVARLGKVLKTMAGMNAEFESFLAASGFETVHLVYTDGSPLIVQRPTQLVDRAGEVYRIEMPAIFPVTLTGTWATDLPNLVDVADASLRQALALPSGATMIGTVGFATLQENLDQLKQGTVVTPQQFGAVGDGVADDYTAIQAAIAYAQNNGGYLYFPPGRYLTSQTLIQTKRLRVVGSGRFNSVIVYSGTEDAWLAMPPFAGVSNTDWTWSWLGIVPSVIGGGKHGIRQLLTAATGGQVCFLADSQIWGCFIGDFGQEGVVQDNSVANTDGFFTSQIEYSIIMNGVLGLNVGDSLRYAHLKIYGKNCGIVMNGVAGARQMTVDDCNITTTGGLLAFLKVEEPEVTNCQLEHPGYLSGYTGVYGASVLFFDCKKPVLRGNTCNGDNGAASAPVSPGLPDSTIAFTGNTSFADVTQNDIQKGFTAHINIAQSSVVDTYIDDRNTYYGANPVINDSGTRSILPTLRGSVPFSGTINTGVEAGFTVSIPGARLGSYVQVEYSNGSQGLQLDAWVAASNTIQIRAKNTTAGNLTFSGGNFKCKVSN